MGRVGRNHPRRKEFEDELVSKDKDRAERNGSVIQRQEARTFNPENGSSSLSRPTTNQLVVKMCEHCNTAMYIHVTDAPDPIFTGCEPVVIDIRLERINDDEIVIKGRRSTKVVRCTGCKRKHLLLSFKEVDNGVSRT